MSLDIDYLYQQILDTEQQVQSRLARVAEGNISSLHWLSSCRSIIVT